MSIVTLKDVAKLAGVSHTTVSLALRDSPSITEETKSIVRAAAKKLSYYPNHPARSLVNGKTNIIGIVSDGFSSFSKMEILRGIEQITRTTKSEYSINLFPTMSKNDQILSDICMGKRADGVILISINPSLDLIDLYKKNDCPMIVIDGKANGAIEISTDNTNGAFMATQHLLDSGRRNLALVSGAWNGQEERKKGFIQALEASQIRFDQKMVFQIDENSQEEGQMIFKRIMDSGFSVDGIFCAAGDVSASGIMIEAKSEHISIPEKLSIVGYDDEPFSSMTMPSITTVTQPLFQIGRNGYSKIIRILEGKEKYKPDRFVYEPKLISRASV